MVSYFFLQFCNREKNKGFDFFSFMREFFRILIIQDRFLFLVQLVLRQAGFVVVEGVYFVFCFDQLVRLNRSRVFFAAQSFFSWFVGCFCRLGVFFGEVVKISQQGFFVLFGDIAFYGFLFLVRCLFCCFWKELFLVFGSIDYCCVLKV